MYLIITIDTEEDNWGDYSPEGSTVENILQIPRLQDIFDEYNIKPTYLVTYPVARDEKAISILKDILDREKCEIGTHCHPWNTPPFEEVNNKKNSMLCNLPSDLQFKKLSYLHNTITKNFGIKPVSFRAGRWGFSREVATNIYKLGYQIDTSITPYTDWTDNFGPDYFDFSPYPFRFHLENTSPNSHNSYVIEIPPTIGFLHSNFRMNRNILQAMRRKPLKYLKLIGFAEKFKIINKVWLSPEFSDNKTMIKLSQLIMKMSYPLINMVFHSSVLKAGKTPYVKTESDEKEFLEKIRQFLIFAKNEGIESITLSDVTKIL